MALLSNMVDLNYTGWSKSIGCFPNGGTRAPQTPHPNTHPNTHPKFLIILLARRCPTLNQATPSHQTAHVPTSLSHQNRRNPNCHFPPPIPAILQPITAPYHPQSPGFSRNTSTLACTQTSTEDPHRQLNTSDHRRHGYVKTPFDKPAYASERGSLHSNSSCSCLFSVESRKKDAEN
jgi:hypothetical protein